MSSTNFELTCMGARSTESPQWPGPAARPPALPRQRFAVDMDTCFAVTWKSAWRYETFELAADLWAGVECCGDLFGAGLREAAVKK